jgi:hypothetical protein
MPIKQRSNPNKFYLWDLTAGVFMSLANNGVEALSTVGNSIDLAFEQTSPTIQSQASIHSLRTMFHLDTSLYGDNLKLRDQIVKDRNSGHHCFSLFPSNGLLYLKRGRQSFLETLSGSLKMYELISEEFFQYYTSH